MRERGRRSGGWREEEKKKKFASLKAEGFLHSTYLFYFSSDGTTQELFEWCCRRYVYFARIVSSLPNYSNEALFVYAAASGHSGLRVGKALA